MVSVVMLCREGIDQWVWKEGSSLCFTVKYVYSFLQRFQGIDLLDGMAKTIFKNLWQCKVPYKVLAFSWRLLLNRSPTREQLAEKGIINHNTTCVFCFNSAETVNHLFFTCSYSYQVMLNVYSWFGVFVALH